LNNSGNASELLGPVGDYLQKFEINYTNRKIGGVWDLPMVPSWLRVAQPSELSFIALVVESPEPCPISCVSVYSKTRGNP